MSVSNDLSLMSVTMSAYGNRPKRPISVLGISHDEPIDFFDSTDTPSFRVIYAGPKTEAGVTQVFEFELTDDFALCDACEGDEARASKEHNFGQGSWGGSFRTPPSKAGGYSRQEFPSLEVCSEYAEDLRSSYETEPWFGKISNRSWQSPCKGAIPKSRHRNEFRYGEIGDDTGPNEYHVSSSYPVLSAISSGGNVLANNVVGFSDNVNVFAPVDAVVSSDTDRSRASLLLVISGLLFGIGGSVLAAVVLEGVRFTAWLAVDKE